MGTVLDREPFGAVPRWGWRPFQFQRNKILYVLLMTLPYGSSTVYTIRYMIPGTVLLRLRLYCITVQCSSPQKKIPRTKYRRRRYIPDTVVSYHNHKIHGPCTVATVPLYCTVEIKKNKVWFSLDDLNAVIRILQSLSLALIKRALRRLKQRRHPAHRHVH